MKATAPSTTEKPSNETQRRAFPQRVWPKLLPCLGCQRPRIAAGPAYRLHINCRGRASDVDAEPYRVIR